MLAVVEGDSFVFQEKQLLTGTLGVQQSPTSAA